jgi:predicted RNA methylase
MIMSKQQNISLCDDDQERKGAFYTPQIWVEKSQEYLAKVFGENWQDEYYIWDCCCGTGNLLAGLVNPYNVWASTIDQADIDILHVGINNRRCNLLASHVFCFDFLNDSFDDLPEGLRSIINDPEKQKKLIVYMNPPYAEHGSTAKNEHKAKVATEYKIGKQYREQLGAASRQLYAQFLIRIHCEIKGCKIGLFSTLKHVQSNNFRQFRQSFLAQYLKGFMIPANTFDNVTGNFPIAFQIWDTEIDRRTKIIQADIYSRDDEFLGKKRIIDTDKFPKISKWVKENEVNTNSIPGDKIGYLNGGRNDFQNQNLVFIVHHEQSIHDPAGYYWVYKQNIIPTAIYFAVRHCIKATWLNDVDQFLCPDDGYKTDKEFQSNCLIFTLLHHQNRIKSSEGINHWIPFTASEVGAKDNFQSTFMSDFLQKRKLSKEAKTVFESGKALWTYYHEMICKLRTPPIDASLYEIREFFKGRNEKGKMKTKSADDQFNDLDTKLRSSLKALAEKIQPKVYEYGFLKK